VIREVVVRVPVGTASPPLAFSLVLVPRFPEHRLTGALVPRLRAWTHRLCLAWDWRLDRMDLQPDHISLQLTLEPDVAPGQVVHQLQDDLAARILRTFPQFAADLPSGRFWASTHLLRNGPLPDETEISAFVLDLRTAQGFAPRP
jgi:REP element-mobilizing transposase RayT